ncbi:MAG: YcxB family protein [Oscillochloridaceae bacterium umkhey_bin13]
MIIESTLNRQEFIRHALTRHFRRPTFYIFAFVAAVLTAYAFLIDDAPNIIYLAAWLPVLMHTIVGLITITRQSGDKNLPLYLPTRYELTRKGIELSSRQGRTELSWADFRAWRKVVGVYELALTNGQLLVITQRAVPPRQTAAFEELLTKQITPQAEAGVFDQ